MTAGSESAKGAEALRADLDEEGRSKGGNAVYDARVGRSVGRDRWTVPVVADEEKDSSLGFELIRSVVMMSRRPGANVGESGKLALHVDIKGSAILGSCMISSDTRSSKSVPRTVEDRILVGDDDVGVMVGLWSGAEEEPSNVEGETMSSVSLPVFVMDLLFPFPFHFRFSPELTNAFPLLIWSETASSS